MAAGDGFLNFFPEFSDATQYPPARITFWIAVAVAQLPMQTWGTLYEYGVDLYVAHHLVLERANQQAVLVNGTPGQTTGPITSKSVAEVSYTVDTSKIVYEKAGYWNQTSYGLSFWDLMRSLGAGGIQLGYIPQPSPVQTGVFPFSEQTAAGYGG